MNSTLMGSSERMGEGVINMTKIIHLKNGYVDYITTISNTIGSGDKIQEGEPVITIKMFTDTIEEVCTETNFVKKCIYTTITP